MSRGKLTKEARRLQRIAKIKDEILALPDFAFPLQQRHVSGGASERGQAFREIVEEGHLEYRRGVGYTRKKRDA